MVSLMCVYGALNAENTAIVLSMCLGPSIWLVHVCLEPCGVRDTKHLILLLFDYHKPTWHMPEMHASSQQCLIGAHISFC